MFDGDLASQSPQAMPIGGLNSSDFPEFSSQPSAPGGKGGNQGQKKIY